MGGDEVAQGIGGIVAPQTFLVGVGFEDVGGWVGVVLEKIRRLLALAGGLVEGLLLEQAERLRTRERPPRVWGLLYSYCFIQFTLWGCERKQNLVDFYIDTLRKTKVNQSLWELRRVLGLTQGEFAAMIGASKDTVASWDAGRNRLSRSFARRIAFATGVDEESLYRDRHGFFLQKETKGTKEKTGRNS